MTETEPLRVLRTAIVDDLANLRDGAAAQLGVELGIDVTHKVNFKDARDLPFQDLDALILDAHDRDTAGPDQYSGIAITRLARKARRETSIAAYLQSSTRTGIHLYEQQQHISGMLVIAMMSQWYERDELRARFAAAGGDIFWPLNRAVDVAHFAGYFPRLAAILHDPVDWRMREVRGRLSKEAQSGWLPDTRTLLVNADKAEEFLKVAPDVVDLAVTYTREERKSKRNDVRDRLIRRIEKGKRIGFIKAYGMPTKAIAEAVAKVYGRHPERLHRLPGVDDENHEEGRT